MLHTAISKRGNYTQVSTEVSLGKNSWREYQKKEEVCCETRARELSLKGWEGHRFSRPTERKVTRLPEADGQDYLDHFRSLDSPCRLLLLGACHFEAPLLTLASLNTYNLRRGAKQRKMPSTGKHHALGNTSALPDECKTPDLEIKEMCRFPSSAACTVQQGEKKLLILDKHSPFRDLGHSWRKGQQHTYHTISIYDESLITSAVCKGFFFSKCIHCLVIYLLRSLIKGQQS